jgi:hypothetical protein
MVMAVTNYALLAHAEGQTERALANDTNAAPLRIADHPVEYLNR